VSSTRLESALRVVAAANGVVAVLLFAALTAVVALQVLTRFVLHVPVIWSEEAARFLFFWVVLLGSALSVRTRRHFVIDVTMGRARGPAGRARFLLDAVPDLCVVGFSLLLLVQGLGYARVGMLRVATNSGVIMGLVYAAIPVFAALAVAYAAGNLVLGWAAFVRGGARARGAPGPPGGAV
jgi:TRAP-type C4-dicarboxylate transport system permease small subunit